MIFVIQWVTAHVYNTHLFAGLALALRRMAHTMSLFVGLALTLLTGNGIISFFPCKACLGIGLRKSCQTKA